MASKVVHQEPRRLSDESHNHEHHKGNAKVLLWLYALSLCCIKLWEVMPRGGHPIVYSGNM